MAKGKTRVVVIKDPRDAQKLASTMRNMFNKPVENDGLFFKDLGILMDNDVQQQFRKEGAAGGPRAIPQGLRWPPLSDSTMFTKKHRTPKIRYGTDRKPKRTAAGLKEYKSKNNLWYKPGIMKGYEGTRRYSNNSKLLQASGGFRKSFRIQKVDDKGIEYGTRMGKLAKNIQKAPKRLVLFVTKKDRLRYLKKFTLYYEKQIRK